MPKLVVALHPLVMIRTFSARLRVLGRFLTGGSAGVRRGAPFRGAPRFPGRTGGARSACLLPGSEAGDTLIEVIVSALLTGLIAVSVLTGLNESTKVSQDERAHNQASVLAAQSQEQLRSDPGSTLNALAAAPHEYTQTVGGTIYKITQSATFVNGTGGSGGCSSSSSTTETSKNIEITSSVDWHALEAVKRAPVTQSSVITPPDGSGLEVDVTNLGSPEEGVSGVSVFADGAQTTTGSKGCVIYTGIPATTASVEASRPEYVLPSGGHKYIAKEVSIAPNVITHTHVYLGHGGRITAEFTTNHGSTSVEGDTFVAYNSAMGVTPEFEVGSVEYGTFNSEGKYETQPGTVTGSTMKGYSTKATTAVSSSYYPSGDLFPFTSSWTVYAGDCTENNPKKNNIEPGSPIVLAGGNISVSVPTSHVTLNLYKKLTTEPETTKQEVKITNLSCTKASPEQVADNAVKPHYEHYQLTSTTGHLEVPYQPFGEFEICLAYNNTSTTPNTHSIYTTTYTNTTEAGQTLESILALSSSTTYLKWNKTTSTTTTKC
jgi:type II secretory pathway pseudopilin PulG